MDEQTIEQADEQAQADEQTVEPEIVESAITQPTKLIRIASMTRAMLEEVRQAPLDEAGRKRLLAVYTRTLEELKEVLSDDLREELDDVFLPLTSQIPSESELRIAQAQLVGWLEGLFHGIQASLWTQQMAAQAQLQEVRSRKSLEAPDVSAGQYL